MALKLCTEGGAKQHPNHSFCRNSCDLALSTRKSLVIVILRFWCAKVIRRITCRGGWTLKAHPLNQGGEAQKCLKQVVLDSPADFLASRSVPQGTTLKNTSWLVVELNSAQTSGFAKTRGWMHKGYLQESVIRLKVKSLVLEFLESRRTCKNRNPQEIAKKWTFLSLAFYNAPSLHIVERSLSLRSF